MQYFLRTVIMSWSFVFSFWVVGAEQGADSNPQHAAYLKASEPRELPALDWDHRQRYETEHYRLETNLSESSAAYVARLLEAIYTYYSKKFHEMPNGRFEVQVFASFDEFAAQMSSSYHHTLQLGESGGYISQLHALLLPWVTKVPGMQPSIIHDPSSVLIHEGFHQFYDAVLNTQDPTWLNEGMATYFENAVYDGHRLVDPGISPTKLRGMQSFFMKGTDESLEHMMNVPHHQFIGQQYCEAWSFLFWMMWGDPLAAQRTVRQKRLFAYIGAISDPEMRTSQAFEQAMGINLEKVTPAWKSFVMALDPTDLYGGLDYMKPKSRTGH